MTIVSRDLTPRIALGKTDHQMLTALAQAGLDRTPELAETLLGELERARVVADGTLPPDVTRMGSRVTYTTASGAEQTVTLVYPALAEIDQGMVSVMSPIGTALIGLKAGQSITWRDRSGRRQQLTVLEVAAAENA